MARAIATRCCMPPDSCHGWLFAASARPTASSASSTSRSRVARGRASCAAAEARRCRVRSATGRGCGRTPGRPAPSAAAGPVTRHAVHLDHAAGGPQQAGDALQQRGLAAPGRPDDADQLAGVHREAEVADRLDVARRATRRPCAGARPAAWCSAQARSTSLHSVVPAQDAPLDEPEDRREQHADQPSSTMPLHSRR